MKTLVLVLVAVLLSVVQVQAIKEPEVGLVAYSFDNLTISVPENWLTWKQEDYSSLRQATEAARDMVDRVNPDGDLPQISQTLRFLCLGPQMIDNIPLTCQVYTASLTQAMEEEGVNLEEVTPADVLCTIGVRPEYTGQTDNGSMAITLINPDDSAQVQLSLILTVYFFPDEDVLALVVIGHHSSLSGADLNNVRQMAVSLRPFEEEFQEDIWDNFEKHEGRCPSQATQ